MKQKINSVSEAGKILINKMKYHSLKIGCSVVSLINILPTIINELRVYENVSMVEALYYSMEDFKLDFDEGKKKLGIENLTIYVEINDNTDTQCEKNKDGTFSARFNLAHLGNFTIQHELYHIKRMDEGKLNSKSVFVPFNSPYEEWLATSYAIKAVKRKSN